MSGSLSPRQQAPFLAKRGKISFNIQRCIVCQLSSSERLCNPTNKGRTTPLFAIDERTDDSYRVLIEAYKTFENLPVNTFKYHRSCYKSYTSKQNLSFSNSHVSNLPSSQLSEMTPRVSCDLKVTRSVSTKILESDGSVCIFL